MSERQFYRGQIYYVYPREVSGCEQSGGRPAIIVSNDVGNEFSRVVEVVFLTTREKKPLPTHVAISSARYPSTALCEQIDSVDKERIGDYINEISQAELKELERALLVSLNISCNLKGSKALETWRKMMENYDFNDEPEDPVTTSSPEEEKETEKVMETVTIPVEVPVERNIEEEPAYIRVSAERDIFKELYMNLLQSTKSA